jgi:pimeloyl-ACP methyl ester carboxylesterase
MKEQSWQHITLETNGIRLHCVQAGPPDGALVILLHGFPEFWYGWRHQIEPLAQAGYWVLAPDQRGYNLSDKPSTVDAYRIGILAKDVIGLIHALGRERALLIGHDWGAAVAWHTAMHYPQLIAKLGILNVPHPTVMVRTLRSSLRQIIKSWYIFFFQIPRLPEWTLSRNNYAAMRRMLKTSAKQSTFSADALDRYVQAWRQPGALSAMINWYRAMFRSQIASLGRSVERSHAGRVEPPTLMIWGAKDIALDRSMAQPSIELCKQGRLVFFEQATHWVQHDEPERVSRLLLDFLKE